MDKRVIAIIFILIIGGGCMFYAAYNSHTVGSAITTFSKTTITLPPGFSVGSTNDHTAELYNKNSPEKINITDLGKNDSSLKEYEAAYAMLSMDPSVKNIKNSTKTVQNSTVYTLSYQAGDGMRYSSFLYAYDHVYCINMVGFNDTNKVNETLDLIIETMHPDYKQSKD